MEGVLAGALWGLIYIAPLMVPEYNPVLVALSRFIMFGVVSLPFLWILRKDLRMFSRADVKEAFRLPFFGNVIFYSLLTMCIRLAGAPLAGMFMAVIPVLVALIGNYRSRGTGREVAWKTIVPPILLILFGLVVANWSEFQFMTAAADSPANFWIGVGFGIAAVFAWTWFSIMNGEWLLAHPQHNSAAWTALQGVTVLPVALALFAVCAYALGWLDTSVTLLGPAPWRFLAVALMIGLLCSWVAMYFWNAMSQRLPTVLAGHMIVFETVFAVLFAHAWRGAWPSATMLVGLTFLIAGVFVSLAAFRAAKKAN